MTEDEKLKEHTDRYNRALHAMQSGVAMKMQGCGSNETTPKHLRVGINAAMVEHSALAQLMIEKGLISKDEYLRAIASGMEAEVRSYEEFLTKALFSKVTLL